MLVIGRAQLRALEPLASRPNKAPRSRGPSDVDAAHDGGPGRPGRPGPWVRSDLVLPLPPSSTSSRRAAAGLPLGGGMGAPHHDRSA